MKWIDAQLARREPSPSNRHVDDSTREFGVPPRQSQRLRALSAWGVLLSVVACVLGLHFQAVHHCPLDAYGLDGGEALPHLQRLYADRMLESQGWLATLLHPLDTLAALDGQYPALLHLQAALWRQAGGADLDNFAWIAHLNLLFLALLAISVATLARALLPAHVSSAVRRETSLWSATLVLLLPGLLFPARRHYYDLPMTAWILATAAFLLGGRGLGSLPRALIAGLMTVMALWTKWAAALYLAPAWGVAITLWTWRAWQQSSATLPRFTPLRPLLNAGIALTLVAACTLPLALKPDGSFQFQRRVGLEQAPLQHDMVGAARFYLDALVSMGSGPVLMAAAVLLLVSALLASVWSGEHRSSGVWRVHSQLFIITAFLGIFPVLYLMVGVRVWDGRYLQPLLPWGVILVAVLSARQEAESAQHREGLWSKGVTVLRWTLPLIALWEIYGMDTRVLQISATPASHKPWQEPGQEAWRERWWVGSGQADISLLKRFEPVVQEVLTLEPSGQLLLHAVPPRHAWTYLWQYLLERHSPGTAQLMSWPSAEDAGRGNAWDPIDAVVVCADQEVKDEAVQAAGFQAQAVGPVGWGAHFQAPLKLRGPEGNLWLYRRIRTELEPLNVPLAPPNTTPP